MHDVTMYYKLVHSCVILVIDEEIFIEIIL